jgi:pentatricopeptide repeat protein
VYGRLGRVNDAVSLHTQAAKRNIATSNVSRCTLLRVLFDARRFDEAIEHFERMISPRDHLSALSVAPSSSPPPPPPPPPSPSLSMIKLAIRLYASAGRISDAVALFETLATRARWPDLAPDTMSFNILLDALGRARKPRRAWELFNTVSTRFGLDRDVVSFNTMLSAYARAGFATEAREVFDSMPRHGFAPDTYAAST